MSCRVWCQARPLILVVALTLAAALLSSCGSFRIGTGDCEIKANEVHYSDTAGQMGGKATIKCTVPVTDARLEVRLERKDGQSWTLVADNLHNTGDFGPGVGTLKPSKTYVRQVFVPCTTGTYRTAARGSASYQGETSRSLTWTYGNQRTDPCPGS